MSQKSTPTLVFDWGDTLMRVYPEYSGAMVDWPEVAAVKGASQALAALQGRFRLVVATNAANSSATQIRAALERVDLARFFDAVYTFTEIGARKPDPAFFHRLAGMLGQPAHELIMIGDDFLADITGAQTAGWSTIWYNPDLLPAPALLPVQSAEMRDFSALPAILAAPMLPTITECTTWTLQAGTTFNLGQHVQQVAAVAYWLALRLRAEGVAVDPLLAHRGGLLHDLAKLAPPLPDQPHVDHGEAAAGLLLARGEPALAEIARRHILHAILDPARRPENWEQKLVYLSDKLIEQGRLVNVEQRLDALRARYPEHADSTAAAMPAILALRDELCRLAGFSPADLIPRLKTSLSGREQPS